MSRLKSKKSQKDKIKRTPSKGPCQLLRGFKDILPDEQKYWSFILGKAEKLAQVYGFKKIETPILEEAALFTKAVGEETEIAEEMYVFQDKSKEKVALRPEFTASVVRAYIEHGMLNLPQPVKVYSFGPLFRYSRPQAGRYRQFHQFNLEILGSSNPILDAQIISFSHSLFQELSLEVALQINSLGCRECRTIYKKKLLDFYRDKKYSLCSNCQKRLTKNPLRVLDCKEEICQKIIYQAPQILDFLCEDCKAHFMKTLEYLDGAEISYNLNPHLVRGLDYYEKTVFEIWPLPDSSGSSGVELTEKTSSQLALGGGGRYDKLVEMLGGPQTPACGVGFGLERIILEMKKRNIEPPKEKEPDVFLAQLGEEAKKRILRLFEELREKGIRVAENFSKDNLKSQLEVANKLGVKYCLILGQREVLDKTIIIRDMTSGVQETVPLEKIVLEIKKRLKKS